MSVSLPSDVMSVRPRASTRPSARRRPVSALIGRTKFTSGDFHLFPDDLAKQFEAAYQSFADNIVMSDISE